MTVRFNVPPNWRQHLPDAFQPETAWTPEPEWGAPPAGWYMWVNAQDGSPVMPPPEYAENPYLYMYVMPSVGQPTVPTTVLPQTAGSDSQVLNASPGSKKKLGKGAKIGLGVAGFVVVVGIIGALSSGGGSAPTGVVSSASSTAQAELSASPATVESPRPDNSAPALAAAESEAAASSKAEEEAEASRQAEEEARAEAEQQAKDEAEASAKAEEEAQREAEASAKAEAEAGTRSQQNALRSAENYLSFMAFSRKSLIEQLEFEQFAKDDATWAVDRVEVDWNEQAAKSAENYLSFTSFSKAGLVDQLIFEGFTRKQAEYGVAQTGL